MYERRTKKRFDVGGSSAAPPPPPVRDQYPWPREHEDEPIPPFDHFDDTHKAAKSVACRNRPIVDTRDDYDSIFFNEWLKVSIEPTRFVDPDVIRALGIKSGLKDLFVELGMGNLATNPQVLYPELVRQFMATVNIYYANERAKRANEGVLTFFIRYRVPLSTLCTIYRFDTECQHAVVPEFPGISKIWEHITTGYFESAKSLHTDICHPTLRYFMKVLANTLFCKMVPNNVRVQELTLAYYAVWSLVHMEDTKEPADDVWPNIGAVFAEYLIKLRMKPFQSKGRKKETPVEILDHQLKAVQGMSTVFVRVCCERDGIQEETPETEQIYYSEFCCDDIGQTRHRSHSKPRTRQAHHCRSQPKKPPENRHAVKLSFVRLVIVNICLTVENREYARPPPCSSRRDEAVATDHTSIGARTKPLEPPEVLPPPVREPHTQSDHHLATVGPPPCRHRTVTSRHRTATSPPLATASPPSDHRLAAAGDSLTSQAGLVR
ncbi:hypothetical protein DY000_02052739 [Brassica cretica]|uniref:Arabidopsis retrotransposon Orf1 C-terminal domain-containing protein n=1 Tax=Brassica cretica TaxID=69181 RepID=A0ABQ7A841_BRACR|nr:hypothetical protein DY000_02052739 [Brassica cretica]